MRFPLTLAAAALLAASGAAHAASISQTLSQTINYSGTGPIENFGGIALFNPDLGTLNSVTQTLQGNVTFTPGSPSSYFEFGVAGPGTPITSLIYFSGSGPFTVSATTGPTLEESTSQFGQQYVIEPFDVSINNGTLVSIGPVTDTFTFNYTPAAVTPEPSSLLLLGTGLAAIGLAGVAGARHKRTA